MVTAATLKDRRMAAKGTGDPDLVEAERLKARLARSRDKRVPLYLSRDELLSVCRWKLGDQYVRAALSWSQAPRSASNARRRRPSRSKTRRPVRARGTAAILRLLPGVGIGAASAILALCYPKRYAPLDSRAWRALFDERRGSLDAADYRRYLARLSELVAEVRLLDPKGPGRCSSSPTTPEATRKVAGSTCDRIASAEVGSLLALLGAALLGRALLAVAFLAVAFLALRPSCRRPSSGPP